MEPPSGTHLRDIIAKKIAENEVVSRTKKRKKHNSIFNDVTSCFIRNLVNDIADDFKDSLETQVNQLTANKTVCLSLSVRRERTFVIRVNSVLCPFSLTSVVRNV